MQSLLETITSIAIYTFPGPVTPDNVNQWNNHWFDIADECRDELKQDAMYKAIDLIAKQREITRSLYGKPKDQKERLDRYC